MPTTSPLYRAIAAAGVPLVPLALRDTRQRAGHTARIAAPAALEAWARAHRDPNSQLAWFHASSVGEGLQAKAVLQAFRSRQPTTQVIYTHFSPSAADLAAGIGADWAGYLPYDRPADVGRALRAIRPDLLVFTKLDLWPELSTQAHAAGTRVAMVAGTVAPGSGRLRWPVCALTAPGYRVLDVIGAIAADDAERLVQLGCAEDRITITGDPRIDSVLDLVESSGIATSPVQLGDPSRVLVAGSTWPGDEAVLLEAFGAVHQRHPDARLILVPHEPTLAHLLHIEAAAVHGAIRAPVLLGSLNEGDQPEVLVVDRVGLLARLYAAGSLAYVGGGFGRAGIHSVLEPAAWARPVIIGPNDRGSRDAAMLERTGALTRLPLHDPVQSLVERWNAWLDDPDGCTRAGVAAKTALGADRGAAVRSAELLGT